MASNVILNSFIVHVTSESDYFSMNSMNHSFAIKTYKKCSVPVSFQEVRLSLSVTNDIYMVKSWTLWGLCEPLKLKAILKCERLEVCGVRN